METLPSEPSRTVILAVDDDEDDIDLLRILFRKAGVTHPIDVYRRGEDLMSALSGFVTKSVEAAVVPLLCFLDVKMPCLSGHELLRWIRGQPEFDGLAVVMLSSSEHPDDIKQAAENGAQCYLSKYPQPAVLKRVIDEAERLGADDVTKEWFGIPANLMLRWGLSTRSA